MKNHKLPRHQKHYSFDSINAKKVEEISVNAFYFPRTMTLLIVTILVTFYIVMSRDNGNFEKNIESGLYCMIAFYLVISALAFPNGPFTRPHPVFWRLVFGVSAFYLLCLAFGSCLHLDQIKSVLYWIDPNVRYAKREIDVVEAYAVNCSTITVDRLYSTLDIFVVGHFIGWFVKALALRSYIMCWAISILWEFTEIFFMDVFPNFQECWWDQIIIDICLFNALGIFFGMKVCKYLELRKYRWESIKDIHSTTGKVRRVVMQFTPRNWTGVTWIGPGSSTRRILAVFAVLFMFLVCELNTFFLKHFLRFPATHPFCWGRLILIFASSAPVCSMAIIRMPNINVERHYSLEFLSSIFLPFFFIFMNFAVAFKRQVYVFMTDVTCNRMGTQAWMFIAMTCMETMISVKIGYAEFTNAQIEKIIAWIAITMLMTLAALFGLVYLGRNKRPKQNKHHHYESTDDSCWEKSPDKND